MPSLSSTTSLVSSDINNILSYLNSRGIAYNKQVIVPIANALNYIYNVDVNTLPGFSYLTTLGTTAEAWDAFLQDVAYTYGQVVINIPNSLIGTNFQNPFPYDPNTFIYNYLTNTTQGQPSFTNQVNNFFNKQRELDNWSKGFAPPQASQVNNFFNKQRELDNWSKSFADPNNPNPYTPIGDNPYLQIPSELLQSLITGYSQALGNLRTPNANILGQAYNTLALLGPVVAPETFLKSAAMFGPINTAYALANYLFGQPVTQQGIVSSAAQGVQAAGALGPAFEAAGTVASPAIKTIQSFLPPQATLADLQDLANEEGVGEVGYTTNPDVTGPGLSKEGTRIIGTEELEAGYPEAFGNTVTSDLRNYLIKSALSGAGNVGLTELSSGGGATPQQLVQAGITGGLFPTAEAVENYISPSLPPNALLSKDQGKTLLTSDLGTRTNFQPVQTKGTSNLVEFAPPQASSALLATRASQTPYIYSSTPTEGITGEGNYEVTLPEANAKVKLEFPEKSKVPLNLLTDNFTGRYDKASESLPPKGWGFVCVSRKSIRRIN